nr:DUF4231 domain-containing protein [Micromonospora sp. DSM 115978]
MTAGDAQDEYRRINKDYELAADRLRSAKSVRLAYWSTLISGFLLVLLLAYSVVVGLWQTKPVATRYIGLLALLVVCATMGRLIVRNRREIVGLDLEVRNLGHDRQSAAARIESDSVESLRIYREAAQDTIAQFRSRAGRNLRVHNAIQAIIIVFSIVASTTTAMMAGAHPLSWVSTGLTALVSITAGLAAYFKFRERGYNLQSTADEIERNYNAAHFRLREYAQYGDDELSRLRQFAENVERLREEQRKRELQLEQSPGQSEER